MASVTLASAPEISETVWRNADAHCDAFLHAEPFKHVVIEDFFEPSFAEELLADFPNFDLKLATNEFGQTGGKAVNTNIRTISPVYQELYRLIAAKPFLDLASRLSGIPDLILDPKMYGGGTHDNRHGQELDPHVDFNYDEAQKLHRRLNLIVYLNKDWKTEWGGALEIHSNPRDPATNRITSYDPLFNRCVMFETNERSWHGFPRIDLPADKRHLSRKSISIYLYTKDRPAEEIAPMHGTFYVQRPLPRHIQAGYTLTEQDLAGIQRLLSVRDDWIKIYQRMELEKNREIADKGHLIEDLRSHALAPLTGYILQDGRAEGLYGDGWVAPLVKLRIRALESVSQIELRGYRPGQVPLGRLQIAIDDVLTAEFPVNTSTFEVSAELPKPLTGTFGLTLTFEPEGDRHRADGDDRDLAFVLLELRAFHPQGLHPDLAKYMERLRAAERTIEERTAWARSNEAEAEALGKHVRALWSTFWVRLGGKLGLLPKLGKTP
jgi:hypothetical protein